MRAATRNDEAATVNRDSRDRILDWREELRRLEPDLPRLPAAARLAVRTTVERFLREDAATQTRQIRALDDAA
jgi:hypothetical protein